MALVLASVVTVVGAFGANNYKNSLTGIEFGSFSNGTLNMVVKTKTLYDGAIAPMRRDANTYVLTLPEVNNEAMTPDLSKVSPYISSVNIRTMPYSNTAKGYTRITIKTANSSMNIAATNQVFIAAPEEKYEIPQNENKYTKDNYEEFQNYDAGHHNIENSIQKKETQAVVAENQEDITQEKTNEMIKDSSFSNDVSFPEPEESSKMSGDNAYLWLWALLIVLGSAFFYARAKSKMQEIAGESLELDLRDEEKKESKTKKLRKIRSTIKTLDSAYSKTALMPGRFEYTKSIEHKSDSKPIEELEIVDLDELFQEHKAKNISETVEEEEADALEQFLSGFSFEDEVVQEPENEAFDEEFYEKVVKSSSIRFSSDDIVCINQLLGSEINDETLRNINDYAVSNPIKSQTKDKILENLLTDYAISQNIFFTGEDKAILYKLISVELDKDFITDLRTNPQKTSEMAQDILLNGEKSKKPSEIITLSVKDMLPDLSKELKHHGSKKIESNYKADVVYYAKGYDVKTLSINEKLPDLSVELNKKTNVSKPSADYETVDTTYSVGSGELKISAELPDLKDALSNPEKYEKNESPKVFVDEEALLKNITNVQFKPFYDGTNEFEVLNDFPSISDVQAELSQFAGFEISDEEDSKELVDVVEQQVDSEEEFVDLDKQLTENQEKVIDKKSVLSESAQDLIRKIELTKKEREERLNKIVSKKEVKETVKQEVKVTPNLVKCILEGETYSILSSVSFDNRRGCHLAKNDKGYTILGYIDEKFVKLHQYKNLKSEKIHARLNEELEDGVERYLIRIGLQKFVISVTEDDIQFVMDLC